ncbi:MAG TPA: chromosomal replication initiator protein DnaA [Ruminococcaceae bacterium]|nr:chromosomal replication initiator protein DnaA [Eubacterium sp.]HCK51403.1 chromosomal replication initiator protein DnaA [Oscillospiraceae bacterium]HCS01087.1 chromosomal replication initiator protein DnaA [Oscillospiraceae bacterium]
MSSLSDIYNLVVENYVREYNISASAKELWLDALEPISMEGNVVTLATDTDFKRNTINSIYLEKLEEQFTIVLGNPIKVEIIIKDDIPTTETKFNDIRNSRELTNKIDNIVHDNKVTYTFDNFIVGPSNNLAYAAAKAVSQKQHEKYNPLFIYGDSGLGKTHLLSAIQNEMTKNYPGINIIYISAETFTNEFLHSITANKTELFDEKYRNADALLIDDIQFIAGKEQTEEKFFHIFNELYKLNKAIVLTSDRPAKEIKSISDRLKTRFSSGLAADVRAPEYETRLAIIQRKADLLNFKIPDDVVDFIATKLKSNIRQIEGVVTKMNALYMVSQIKPTIVVAQNVIKDIVSDHQPIPITVDKIISEAAKIYNVDPDEIRSPKRNSPVSSARKVAIYVIQEITGLPYETIGQEFSGRDHSTVVYAIKNVKEMMAKDSNFRSVIEDLIKNIKANQ